MVQREMHVLPQVWHLKAVSGAGDVPNEQAIVAARPDKRQFIARSTSIESDEAARGYLAFRQYRPGRRRGDAICATVSSDFVRDAISHLVRKLRGAVSSSGTIFAAFGLPEPALFSNTESLNRSAP